MTGEEMLKIVEAKAVDRGCEEAARRMLRIVFERRFGSVPAGIETSVSRATGLQELERLMALFATLPRDELERELGLRVH